MSDERADEDMHARQTDRQAPDGRVKTFSYFCTKDLIITILGVPYLII